MITTQGHQVGVLPQFQPPDPSLLAFNPQQMAQGALSSLQIGGALEQMKALRQHTEELAKMSNARNKLLQAQADLATLNAEFEQGTQAGKKAASNATSAATVKTAGPLADFTAAKAGLDLRLLPKQEKLVNTQQDLAQTQVTGALTRSNITEETSDLAAEIARKKVYEEFALLDQKQRLEKNTLDIQEMISKGALEITPLQQKVALERANFDVTHAKDAFQYGFAKLKLENDLMAAQAKNLEAQAEEHKSKANADKSFEVYRKMEVLEGQYLNKERIMSSFKVVGGAGVEIPLAAYEADTRKPSGDPKKGIAGTGIFAPKRNPDADVLLQQLYSLRERRAALTQKIAKFNFDSIRQDSISGPPVGTESGGYRFKGGDPKDKSNWEKIN